MRDLYTRQNDLGREYMLYLRYRRTLAPDDPHLAVIDRKLREISEAHAEARMAVHNAIKDRDRRIKEFQQRNKKKKRAKRRY